MRYLRVGGISMSMGKYTGRVTLAHVRRKQFQIWNYGIHGKKDMV